MKSGSEKEIKLLIFDLDGTLADTIWSIREAVNLAMVKNGYPERSYDEVRLAIGNGARKLISRSMPSDAAADESTLKKVYTEYEEYYDETYIHCTCCYDGMLEALIELKGRGYTVAVLSNKQDKYVKPLARSLAPNIVSLAMGQTELPIKPDPTAPTFIARTLGFENGECAFIGDSEVDVETAKNAGMVSVACSWGYRSKELLASMSPDYLIDEPKALTEIF